jgi:hypothetical protein
MFQVSLPEEDASQAWGMGYSVSNRRAIQNLRTFVAGAAIGLLACLLDCGAPNRAPEFVDPLQISESWPAVNREMPASRSRP